MNTQEQKRADLSRVEPTGDALDYDIEQSKDRMACAFGSKLEAPHPWVIKRTCIERGQRVVEFYTGMARTDRDWRSEKPSWNRLMVNGVGFATREEALTLIRVFGLKPRAEVVLREPVENNGR